MLIPYLTLADPRAAMALDEKAFGATSVSVMEGPDASVMHAEMAFGDQDLYLSGEFPGFAEAPSGRSPVNFMLYVDDVDASTERARKAGMTVTQDPADQFWGDRTAKVSDGIGYEWTLAKTVEEVGPEEMAKRVEAYASEMG